VPALIGVMVLVNAARAVAQAPFTFGHRTDSAFRWAGGQVKTLAVTITVGAALTVPLYALIRASSNWWLWAWALFALVTVAAQLAMPLILRVQTGPLSAARAELADQVATIATRAGVKVGAVLVADRAIGRGPRCNAYVVGWGPTRRVVLESGIAAWPPALLDQVVAHEIGHWRLRHTAKRLPVTLVAQLATFALAAALLSFQPLLDVAGLAGVGDPRSYPLVLALTVVLVLPARLALAAYDRRQERQADRFALTLLGDAAHFEAMLDRAADDGGAPRQLPWWRHTTATHPPIAERILACQRYARAEPIRSIS
jgi:STE24 endopeptidase